MATPLALMTTLALLLAGCSSTTKSPDASTKAGAGKDAGAAGDGGLVGKIPRKPGQNPASDPIKNCSRFDAKSCVAGQECKVLVRKAAADTQFTITTGCVKAPQGRGLSAPCDPWNGFALPYETAGLVDEVYLDPCDKGLFCAPDANVRGAHTCQPACESMSGIGCPKVTQFCRPTANDALEDVCTNSDACDPANPAGCGPGAGCYLRLSDTGTGILTVCIPTAAMPVADGQSCADNGTVHISKCRAGSSCWGPPQVPPMSWTEADYLCRRSCELGGGLPDAGADEDGGVTGQCKAGSTCIDVSVSGVTVASGASLGQCN